MSHTEEMFEANRRFRHIRSMDGVRRYPPGAFDCNMSIIQNAQPRVVVDELPGREIEAGLLWTPPNLDGRRWEEVTGQSYGRCPVTLGFVDGLSGPTNLGPVVFSGVEPDWQQPSTLALFLLGEPIAFGRLIAGMLASLEWQEAYGFPSRSIRFSKPS